MDNISFQREKEGDLTQSYDKTPYTNRNFENQRTTQKRHQKTSITQRLRTDLGRSVGVISHPTCVVKPGLKGTNLPTHHKSSILINHTRHGRNFFEIQTDFQKYGYMLKDKLLYNLTL